jgi:hypothetical protein
LRVLGRLLTRRRVSLGGSCEGSGFGPRPNASIRRNVLTIAPGPPSGSLLPVNAATIYCMDPRGFDGASPVLRSLFRVTPRPYSPLKNRQPLEENGPV